MNTKTFEQLVTEEYARIPEEFAVRLKNVALLVEDVPDAVTRKEEKLSDNLTLLGLYRGVPLNARGEWYGVGAVVPDTITLYRKPIQMRAMGEEHTKDNPSDTALRKVIKETLWHEIGHALGLDESMVEAREARGTNHFSQ